MSHHKLYPSVFFINFINHLIILNDIILNPIIRTKENIEYHDVLIDHNQLQILDALMKNGSKLIYENHNNFHPNPKYIYSEHSGTIKISNYKITQIIISAQTNRINTNDSNILLPIHMKNDFDFEYIFHTHPNDSVIGGRIKDGILYEFPSANDIFNFMNHFNKGSTLGSIIIAPEGLYLIRPRYFSLEHYPIKRKSYQQLQKFLIKLEDEALQLHQESIKKLDNKIFYENIANDFITINKLNDYLKIYNIYIEYYPRYLQNNNWILRSIYLKIINILI
jgi:hypothetical protein